jgi:hypothetical protein
MKLYLTNIGAALTNLYLLLFLWGLSAGIASSVPVIAMIGCVALFVVIPPLLVHIPRMGYLGGFLCSLLILPWSIGYLVSDFQFSFTDLFVLIPCLLAVYTGCLSVYYFVRKRDIILPKSSVFRLLLSIVPALLFVLYLISISGNFRYIG